MHARNAIISVQIRIDAAVEEYHHAYDALHSLAPILLELCWEEELLKLMPEDVRDLSSGKDGESEGRQTISWIWHNHAMRASAESNNKYTLDRELYIWAIIAYLLFCRCLRGVCQI